MLGFSCLSQRQLFFHKLKHFFFRMMVFQYNLRIKFDSNSAEEARNGLKGGIGTNEFAGVGLGKIENVLLDSYWFFSIFSWSYFVVSFFLLLYFQGSRNEFEFIKQQTRKHTTRYLCRIASFKVVGNMETGKKVCWSELRFFLSTFFLPSFFPLLHSLC